MIVKVEDHVQDIKLDDEMVEIFIDLIHSGPKVLLVDLVYFVVVSEIFFIEIGKKDYQEDYVHDCKMYQVWLDVFSVDYVAVIVNVIV